MVGERTDGGQPQRQRVIAAVTAAAVVLVVGGTVLAALALHPSAGVMHKARGPLGGNPVLVIGLAVCGLIGAVMLRSAYTDRVRSVDELGEGERRLADTVGRILFAAPLAVPLLVLVLHRFDTSDGRPRPERSTTRAVPSASDYSLPPETPPGSHHGLAGNLPVWVVQVLIVLGILLGLVMLVVGGWLLWRHLTRPQEAGPVVTYALDDEQERLAQAVDTGRRALREVTDARAAVIACYAAMEASLAQSGVTRRESDSPGDLLERVVERGLPVGGPAGELTVLFREARFSTHPMDDGHRARASAALAAIADGLEPGAARGQAEVGAL